ncbi:transglutaminase-like domain-containing protein [Mucilaginibacter boryungensis]|uniref:Transglutaminase family protein n=1 Tax=Mucilaginibacter boryungensis TaxID=768480 RepID=A0ABR9XHA4_9SPHI|nr:transglutaminase family protein [Mucilaginibacter boryungensis]MBE9666444.1 transglutaminase family protein [Mucilaginibacter boryungensis]
MKFNVSAQLEYNISSASTLVLNIHALRTPEQTVLQETFTVNPEVRIEELQNIGGENRSIRLEVPDACQLKVNYTALVNNSFVITNHRKIQETPVSQLTPEILPFLSPSRYCQSDKLYRLANHMFGDIDSPYAQVMALTNWIRTNVLYLSGSTNAQTSAYDTVTEQAGVCRDFAHLGIALCRALTIPARYFTGYAYKLKPADFHACFEAYLGNQWVLFDATGLAPLNGMVKIATGRDAADAAVASIFGNAYGTRMTINCEVAEDNFKSYFYPSGKFEGLSYL